MNYATANARWAGIGPYYAMFPLSFVDEVVQKYTCPGDTILDPFAGRASSVFAGAALGRPSIGIEINPVGWVYGQTKLHPASKGRVLARLHEIGALAKTLPPRTGDGLPEFFRWCFARSSLRFLLTARTYLDWRRSNVDRTLMTLILIDLHGGRTRSFSNQMRQSRAMEPAYSIRWWRAHRQRPPLIAPVEFMEKKIEWRYAKGTPDLVYGEVLLGDSSRLLQKVEKQLTAGKIAPFQLLLTSPPYIGISDYYRDQWLRLWMLGGAPSYARCGEDHKSDFGCKPAYTTLLRSVFEQAAELMKSKGVVYVRTDARQETFAITRQVLYESFPHWRQKIIARPYHQQTQTVLYGDKSPKPGEKDIILYGPRR